MARTIVMIHGAFCGGWAFDRYRDYFSAKRYVCLAPDLRHHGESYSKGDNDELAKVGLLDYLADLEALIANLDERPILMGHSMGGLLAQMLAAKGMASAAVLLAPSPPWGVVPSTMMEIASAQGLILLMGDYWNSVLEPTYDIAERHALDRLPSADRDRIFARFSPESGRATFEIIHWMFDAKRASAVDASTVNCPMLFVAGDLDKVNAVKTVKRVAKRYRDNARFITAENHSHWLIGEPGWNAIAETSANWLTAAGL